MTDNKTDELTLQDLIMILWANRWLVLATTLFGAILGYIYLRGSTPIYQVDALVQVEQKGGKASALLGDLGGMFDVASPAEAEIEIVRSRMVLGRVVDRQKLQIVVTPKLTPVVGKYLNKPARALWPQVDRLEVGEAWHNEPFEFAVIDSGTTYRVVWEKQEIGQGRVGAAFAAMLPDGDSLKLFVSAMGADKGQRFSVKFLRKLDAIAGLSKSLTVSERGKKSGMLGMAYQGPDPVKAAHVVNGIAESYVAQNVERKSEEAQKTLEFLRGQLPELKMRMELAEDSLNQYRLRVGSVDLPQEAKLILDQNVGLESQLLGLQQKGEEMRRLYKDDHPNVQALQAQMDKLRKQLGGVDSQVRRLPKTQQDILRLAQEARVAAELYNNMLNNAQQLEVAKAGQIGNVRIVDIALPTSKPVKPRRSMMLALALMLGFGAGAGMALGRRLLRNGIEDPKLIEQKLGLPVYATIPHSKEQESLDRDRKNKKVGLHLLAHTNPDSLAVESLRSLRTALRFALMESDNKTLLITGPSPSIGKSFVSCNMAAVLAMAGEKVLLVDCDMRRGHLHAHFSQERGIGLSDYLGGSAEFSVLTRPSGVPGLDLIGAGGHPPNPSELLLHARMGELLAKVGPLYDRIILDAPPILAVTDAAILGKLVGGALMLVRHGRNPLREIEIAYERLQQAGTPVKGVVVNDVDENSGGKKYAYQYGYRKRS